MHVTLPLSKDTTELRVNVLVVTLLLTLPATGTRTVYLELPDVTGFLLCSQEMTGGGEPVAEQENIVSLPSVTIREWGGVVIVG